MLVTIRRRWIQLAAAALSAAVAIAVGARAVAGAEARAREGFIAVNVATRFLAEGAELKPADLREITLPPEAVPAGAGVDGIGRTVTIPLLPGDVLTAGKLAPSGRGASALLRPGEVAAALAPAAPVAAEPGEVIRITAAFDPQRYAGNDLVRVIAPRARVLSRDEHDGRLTVALTPRQRDQLSIAATEARIDVALVAPGGGDLKGPADN